MAKEESKKKGKGGETGKRRRRSGEKEDQEQRSTKRKAKDKSERKVKKPSPAFSDYDEEKGDTLTVESREANFESSKSGTINDKEETIKISSARTGFRDQKREAEKRQVERTHANVSFEEQEGEESTGFLKLSNRDSDFEDFDSKIKIEKRRKKVTAEKMKSEPSSISSQNDRESQSSESEEMEREVRKVSTRGEQEEVSEDMDLSTAPQGIGGEGRGREITEFPDLVYYLTAGKGALRSSSPKIILFRDFEKDSFIGAFETLCKRIFREQKGGKPKAKIISRKDELNEKEIKKIVEAEGKGENRIFRIDVDPSELEVDDKDFKDRLEELYSQELGFIVLRATDHQEESEFWELLSSLMDRKHLPEVFRVSPKPLDSKAKKEIAELSWGLLPVGIKEDFDSVFKMARNNYRKSLERLLRGNTLFASSTTRNNGQFDEKAGPESDLHYLIKIFVLKNLVQNLRDKGRNLREREDIVDKILTEKELVPGIIPDLQLKRSGEVFEVETLFGTGIDPLSKIEERVDEYAEQAEYEVETVSFVLDNFTMLRHLNRIRDDSKQFDKHFDVKFYTLDLEKNELLSLKEVEKMVTEIAQGEVKERDEKELSKLALDRFESKN